MNKDTIILEKNKVITQDTVKEALDNLPYNYVKQTSLILDKWKEHGMITKNYTDRYIIKVKKGEENAFNEDILNALVVVGLKNKETKEKFGSRLKKTLENG
jgi:hypothetical protein